MIYDNLKLENQFCFRFYTVSRLITKHYQPHLAKLGINYPQYLVLMVLWEQDNQPVNDIAKRLALETNTITPLLQRMEAQKILVRRQDKTDKRKVIVSLTPHGQEMMEQAKDIPLAMGEGFSDRTMGYFGPESNLRQILDEIIRDLNG